METTYHDFQISTDPDRLDLVAVHDYLCNRSYWAKGIPFEVFRRSIVGAFCFGVYLGDQQVGFARVISDGATIAYIGDVFILEDFRNMGLSKRLMEAILSDARLQGLRRWILATADAHGLYAQFGFTPLAKPDRWMERHNPQAYTP